MLAGCGDTGPPLPPGGIVVEEEGGRERVVSDTAFTPAEMRREQITALEDSGWEQQPDGSYCKDGTRVRVGPPQRERGQPALTRTITDDC
jgi:hypothetical protein